MSDAYLDFVSQQVAAAENVISLIDDLKREVTPLRINTALAHFTNVSVALNSESHRKSKHLEYLEEELQAWMDARIIRIREQFVEDLGKSAAYKISAKEIESAARAGDPEEYKRLRSQIIDLQAEVSWCNRTLIQLNKHGDILEQIGNNMRSEIRSLGVENRMNKPDMQIRSFKNQGVGVPVRGGPHQGA